MFLEW